MGIEERVSRDIRGKVSSRSVEARFVELARKQHGVVTRGQLETLGLSPDQVDRRIAALGLTVVHRGVLALGTGDLTIEGKWKAATLRVGSDSFISHFAAAGGLGIHPWSGGIIDVTVPRRVSTPAGIRIHRAAIPADERWSIKGIPLTSPARTILDLASRLETRQVERLITEAHVARLPLHPSLATLIDRYPGRRGLGTLRAALATFEESPAWTRNDFEERFFDFLDRHGFPRPQTNVDIETRIGTLNVDYAWPAERLIIELDGFGAHGTRPAFRRDRRRDRAIRIAGWNPNRLVWEDLDDEPALACELRALSGSDRPDAPNPADKAGKAAFTA